jgi:hypothetical protein
LLLSCGIVSRANRLDGILGHYGMYSSRQSLGRNRRRPATALAKSSRARSMQRTSR